ncbi:MAG: AraC family transcriptional regulator [Haliscomenobacteraceae bacterium CHB4]|nr:AraC family transcriptional regulator [Haliscomenobacteraceae bacterium CHB4]
MKTQLPPFQKQLHKPNAQYDTSTVYTEPSPVSVQQIYISPEQYLWLARQKFAKEPFLKNVMAVVEQRMPDSLSVACLAKSVFCSRIHFFRRIKGLTGQSPSCFVRSIRLYKALELLCTTDLGVSEIAYSVGFADPKYFSRVFVLEFKTKPSEVRKKNI